MRKKSVKCKFCEERVWKEELKEHILDHIHEGEVIVFETQCDIDDMKGYLLELEQRNKD